NSQKCGSPVPGDCPGGLKADRARAKGHEVKADTSDNPVEKVVEKGKAAVDRAKAEVHKEASKTAVKKARR
ncbi:MAG: hypothetical protein K6T35_02160, partial [Meiothermus silvanus]|nr:hypothetical protein [Allomeiothermus silvanus]